MSTVEVRCQELTMDADRWRAAADRMKVLSRTADSLAMGAEQFGAIADARGVVSAYTSLQRKLETLASNAATEFTKIAGTLTQVAETYLIEDEAGEHDMRTLKDRL